MSVAPLLADGPFVTDGGLETDLLFHQGFDLPEFAAFPLLEDAAGRAALDAYYDQYAAIARAAGQGLLLETPTWRANPDWAEKIGYDAARARPGQPRGRRPGPSRPGARRRWTARSSSASTGLAATGTWPGRRDPDEAAEYHAVQARSFADGGGRPPARDDHDRPPRRASAWSAPPGRRGLPVALSFTVETDGRLPDGTPLGAAVERVDAAAAPDWFGINCAHPTHIAPAFDGGAWQERIGGIRPNASTLTHDELDAMEVLDEGDLGLLTSSLEGLRSHLPNLAVVGGCCGTDARHVASLWGV